MEVMQILLESCALNIRIFAEYLNIAHSNVNL